MKKTIVTAAALVVVSGLAVAGSHSDRETQVNLTTRMASGSVYDASASADSVQYIGCMVYGSAGVAPAVSCDARNALSERLTCGTSDPGLVAIAQGISASSFVSFRCAANGGLDWLVVNNGSQWLP